MKDSRAEAPPPQPTAQPPEQLRYARAIELGGHAGLALLVVAFIVYASGLWPAHVPLERLPDLWSLPVAKFAVAAGMPRGWQWVRFALEADVANLVGIVLLAGCSAPALLALLPLYARTGQRVLASLCVAQVLVLLLAASGILSAGH